MFFYDFTKYCSLWFRYQGFQQVAHRVQKLVHEIIVIIHWNIVFFHVLRVLCLLKSLCPWVLRFRENVRHPVSTLGFRPRFSLTHLIVYLDVAHTDVPAPVHVFNGDWGALHLVRVREGLAEDEFRVGHVAGEQFQSAVPGQYLRRFGVRGG
jgi:hypothetical protein